MDSKNNTPIFPVNKPPQEFQILLGELRQQAINDMEVRRQELTDYVLPNRSNFTIQKIDDISNEEYPFKIPAIQMRLTKKENEND